MLLPGTNLDGLIVLFVGFGLAIGIEHWTGIADKGLLTIFGGALVTTFGVVLRLAKNGDPMQPEPDRPRILFVAAWQMGLVWIGIGTYQMLSR